MKLLFALIIGLMTINAYSFGFKFISMKRIINNNGIRRYSDGTVANSCNEYKMKKTGMYDYFGDVGDGLYAISYGGESATVYCDMTKDTGGWTLVLKMGDQDPGASLITGSFNLSGLQNTTVIGIGATYSKLSDAMINGIKTINYRLEKVQSSFNADPAVGFFPSSCVFQYQSGYSIYNSNNCSTSKGNFTDSVYSTRSTWLNQPNIFGYLSGAQDNLVRVNGYTQYENHNWVHMLLWVK